MSFFWSAPVAFRRVALETPEWTSRDSNHHRQSVSAGKTNAIPTEPSGRLSQLSSVDLSQITATSLSVRPSPLGSLGLRYHVKTRERRGSSFSQLGLEPNRTGLTARSLFFLEESCRVKRSDTQTFSNFSNYFKRVLLQKRSNHKNKRKSISKLFHAQTGSIWFQIGSYLVPIGSYGFYSSQIGSYKLKMVT